MTPPGAQMWRAGDPILFREVYRGRLWTARPATVAAVRDDLIALYLAPGTIFKVPTDTTRETILERLHSGWQLRDHVWSRGRTLHLLRPGVAHSIHLWWLPPDWRFGGWYINLQEPIRPTALGFDSMDHVLDVVIDPDLSWRWKDEKELATAVDLGLMTLEHARDIRGEGERVIGQLEARQPPFCDGWEHWQPDAGWSIPELPTGWDKLIDERRENG
jgi:hypothetical protein